MTKERIHLLESIGFKWSASKKDTWDSNFALLAAFRNKVRLTGFALCN